MPDAPDADWLQQLVNGRPAPEVIGGWPAEETLIFAADTMRIAMPGMTMRSLPCLRCGNAIGADPFQLWTMVGPHPCERNWSHLISVSALLHVTCVGLEPDQVAARIREMTAGCFDQ